MTQKEMQDIIDELRLQLQAMTHDYLELFNYLTEEQADQYYKDHFL